MWDLPATEQTENSCETHKTREQWPSLPFYYCSNQPQSALHQQTELGKQRNKQTKKQGWKEILGILYFMTENVQYIWNFKQTYNSVEIRSDFSFALLFHANLNILCLANWFGKHSCLHFILVLQYNHNYMWRQCWCHCTVILFPSLPKNLVKTLESFVKYIVYVEKFHDFPSIYLLHILH